MADPKHQHVFHEAARTGDAAVDMSGFDLSGIRCISVRLNGMKLAGADFTSADLSGGYFPGCDLERAILKKSRITTADFRNANLSSADLTAADLSACVMVGADLTNANLTRAKLVKTRLDQANLTGANLDRADLRGVQGLTNEQLAAARNSDKAVLDERMLAELGRTGDVAIARHGRQTKKRAEPSHVDLLFDSVKPCFGDVFLLCGHSHPDFPRTGDYGFEQLADLGFEQVDDSFAILADGEPVVWLYPLVKGRVVEHHPGPFDGLRIELADRTKKKRWSKCAARFKESLRIPVRE